MVWWLFVFVSFPCAFAAEPGVDMTPQARTAEYHRFQDDLRKYAEREAWPAVDRTYERCMALYPDDEVLPSGAWAPPTPMDQRDHVYAAHAAQARGDMLAVRVRLVRAMRKEQTQEVLDWLWAMDSTYSKVVLTAPIGTTLTAVKRPFDPIQARSIDFASKILTETGTFTGLLPRGPYTLGDTSLDVKGGVPEQAFSLSGKKKRKKDR